MAERVTLEYLLILVVVVAAVAFIIQCVSLWRTSRTLRQGLERLEKRSHEVEKDIQEVVVKVKEITESLRPLGSLAEELSGTAHTLSELAHRRGEQVDGFVEEMIRLGRDQASKIDYVVTDTVQKFEQTTEFIQKDVLRPAAEIASFVKGVKTGLAYLFSKRENRAQRGKSHPEEELFI